MKKITLICLLLLELSFGSGIKQVDPLKGQTSESINKEEFVAWIASYGGISNAEKDLTLGMMEKDNKKAIQLLKSSCRGGDERGCFQLALKQLSLGNKEGMEILSKLGESGKNKKISLQSAKFLGAYVLDFMPNDYKATSKALNAAIPHAFRGDAEMQFVAANLFASKDMYKDADKMLTKACTNPNATDKILSYCRNDQIVEVVGEDGHVVGKAKCEQGCKNK